MNIFCKLIGLKNKKCGIRNSFCIDRYREMLPKDTAHFLKVLTPNEAYECIINKHLNNTYILDVRNYSEYNAVHIKGAVNIPVENLRYMYKMLPKDKETKILIYCLRGTRAIKAAYMLKDMGYKNLYIWEGASINAMLDKDIIEAK
ncbi:MAG: rhodanese-like domain-containing protein [Clostridia bacterium]